MSAPRRPSSNPGWTGLPVHPLLLAAFPVLSLFAENAVQQVTLNPLWLPLVAALAGAMCLLLVSAAVVRDWQRGALIASLLIALFFSFGHVWNVVSEMLHLGARRYVVGAYLAVGLIGVVLGWRGGRWVAPVSRFLNVAAVLLVAFNAVRVADFALNGSHAAGQSAASVALATVNRAPARRPDIYYIILDRYASGTTLERAYGFDNRPFLDELKRRGFTIAEDSWANYFKTSLSLYSSLTMDYLDVAGIGGGHPPTYAQLHAGLRGHLPVPATLKSLGYEYVQIGNIWEPTATNIDADRVLRYAEGSEFATALLSTTAWSLTQPVSPPGEDANSGAAVRPLTRKHTLFAFDRLEELRDRPGPTFVFAHILVPHPGWAFNADGSFPSTAELASRSDEESYVQQLRWANNRVLEVVGRLLDVPAGEEPVIILQADEGPFPDAYRRNETNFDWLSATPDQVQQKFGILNALYLPGVDGGQAGVTPRLSPVNEFRVVFNAYFDAGLPLLPDVTFLSPSNTRWSEFVEYTRP